MNDEHPFVWFKEASEELNAAFNTFVEGLLPIVEEMTATCERVMTWKWDHESLSEWGRRLDRHGLLDDMAIRREYQIAVWKRLNPTHWFGGRNDTEDAGDE